MEEASQVNDPFIISVLYYRSIPGYMVSGIFWCTEQYLLRCGECIRYFIIQNQSKGYVLGSLLGRVYIVYT